MTVRICVAIRESSTGEALAAAGRAAQWADLVEIRGDYIRDLDVRRLCRTKPCPMIFTLRSREEGGEYFGSERDRLELILEAARCGADYVDVEFSAFWKVVLDSVGKSKVILSHHDFRETPSAMESLVERMAAVGAGAVKIATRACRLSDNLRIAAALKHASARGIRLCALAMGLPGVPSRVLGGLWGSWLVFASLPGGQPTADGQLDAETLLDVYRVRGITADTEIYGVAGRPLGHTLSPLIHNAAFAARQRDAVFLPLEAADVDDLEAFGTWVGLRGASVTIPYKEEVARRALSLSIEADRVGAANTLVCKPGGWHGENSDVEGFLRPLRRRTHLGRMRTLVLGAGGAARAVVHGLRASGATVCIVARDPDKARALAQRFEAEYAPWSDLPGLSWELLVNATPVGMHPQPDVSPVPAEWLNGTWVYDLVYNPVDTRLLQDAAARGCRTIAGSEMFLCQAIKQQQLWAGPPVPDHVMGKALSKALGCAVKP